jgi:PAS domain S-box-containing protein
MTAETLRRLSLLKAIVVFLCGAAAVIGWAIHFPELGSWGRHLVPMRINSAVSLVFAAVSLALLNTEGRGPRQTIGRICALATALIGFLTLFEYAAGMDLRIDDIFFHVRSVEPGNPFPCRMSPVVAACHAMIGLSLLLLDAKRINGAIFSETLAISVQLFSGLGLVGYFYSASALYRVAAYSSIALSSGVALLLLGWGILLARPDRGLVAVLTRNTTGSLVARRMFIAAIVVPLLFGWLRLRGEQKGLYQLEFGTAILVVALIAIFTALIWWTALTLDRSDQKRRMAAQALVESEQRFRVLFEQSPIGKFLIDPETQRIVDCNQGAAEALGYTREELCRLRVSEIDAQLPAQEITRLIRETIEQGKSFSFETRHRTKSGEIRDTMITAARVQVNGRPFNYAAALDITDRKKAERALRESESRLRLFVEHAPAAVAMFDPQMRYLAVSRRWAENHKYSGDLIGKCHYEVFPETRRWSEVHRRGLAGEVLKSEEDPFPRADGSMQWVRWEVRPWFGEDGKIGGILIALEDITARVMAKEALRKSEEQLRLAALASGFGTFDQTFDPPHAEWSPQLKTMFGLPPDAPVTLEDSLKRIHPDDQAKFAAKRAMAENPNGSGEIEDEHRIIRADGEVRWFLVRGRVEFCGGHPARAYGAVLDITERKRAEEELLRAQEQLKGHAENLERTVAERTAKLNEMLQELEAFSYSIAHDMRAPLRAMQGFATILEDEQGNALGDSARSYLKRIQASAHRLDELIQDVLNYSRIVRSDLKLSPLDPQPLLDEIVATYPNLQSPKAEIRLITPFPKVLANTAALTQVFSNLLGNAVKFVEPGVKPVVVVRAETRGDFVRLWFEDNGIGMEKGVEKRIFQMFQRLNRPGLYEGTGIGLAIVRKAVERMDGKVGVESEPGRGSRFWVELHKA